MKKSIFISAAVISLLSACKKEKINPNTQGQPIGGSSYSLMDYVKTDSAGNYWEYDNSRIDSNGTVLNTWHDSAYVANDTVFNGNTYKYVPGYIVQGPLHYMRDSSGFLVNPEGGRFLRITNLPDTIEVASIPEQDVYKICEVYNGTITTPAGTFNNIIKTSMHHYMKLPMDTSFNPVIFEMYFALGVGLIREKYYYFFPLVAEGVHYERELTAYSVQ